MKIQVGDIAIEYEIDGEEGAPVLMLHHSLATSLEMWDDLSLALVQMHRVVRFDARGHGKTEGPAGEYSFAQLAGDAVGLMNVLGIQKATHVGLSMGGMVSQYLGIAAADRVEGLVLVSTTSQMPKASGSHLGRAYCAGARTRHGPIGRAHYRTLVHQRLSGEWR